MYSYYLFLALFAVLSVVTPRPLPRAVSSLSATPSDDGCTDYTPSPTFTPSSTPVPPPVYLSPTTDDCSEPTSSTPAPPPPSLTPSTAPTSSVAPIPATSQSSPSTSVAVPTSSPVSVVAAASSGTNTGGVATYYYQNGNAGACGQVNPDSAIICAMDQARYNSALCGQQVKITNVNNGQTLTVTIADDCPTCSNSNSIDLSVGAFSILSNNDLSLGEFPISWSFV